MSEPAPTPTPAPSPAPSPAPAPVATQRPEWVPEQFFDAAKGAIKPEFGAHYSEIAGFHKTETEKRAALAARKPEDIKFTADALPKELHEAAQKAGLKLTIDEKDPRIPVLREMAIKRGWDADAIGELIALDAQQKLQSHTAEMERVAAEDKKLGANGPARKKAISTWADGLAAKGEFTADERAEVDVLAATAAGISFIEKLIAKANGTVPGNTNPNSVAPKPAEIPVEQRWYGQSQQKAS